MVSAVSLLASSPVCECVCQCLLTHRQTGPRWTEPTGRGSGPDPPAPPQLAAVTPSDQQEPGITHHS